MNIPINNLAFQFLLPTALLIVVCARAGFRIASDPTRRVPMILLIIASLVVGLLDLFALQFGLALSPGHQDATYYNEFYGSQLSLSIFFAMCALVFAYWAWRSRLYGGAGLVALCTAVPALWWGASRTHAALGTPIAALLVIVGLGALVGATATMLPQTKEGGRARRLALWTVAGMAGALGGLPFGTSLAGTSWVAQNLAPASVLSTLLLIGILAVAALVPALLLTAWSRQSLTGLRVPALGLALAIVGCWIALASLPALNQTAVSAPLTIGKPRELPLPEGTPPRPSTHAMSFSRDGKWLAVGLTPESIHPEQMGGLVIWRTSDWSIAANIEPSVGAMWPIWSPRGDELVVVTAAGEIKILGVENWTEKRSWSRPGPLAGGALTPDGSTLWLAEPAALTAWNMQGNTPGGTIPLDEGPTTPPVVAPNAGWIAVGTGPVVNVWHLPTGASWHRLTGHSKDAHDLSVSPASTSLAVGSWDAVVRIWRIQDGVLLASIPDGGERVAFSPDGVYLAGASYWSRSAIYQVGLWQSRVTLPSASVFAYSPDGTWLVSAGDSLDDNIYVWTLPAVQPLPSAPTAGPPTPTVAAAGSPQPLTPANASRLAQIGVLQENALAAVFLPLSNTLVLAGSGIRLFPEPLRDSRPARRWAIDDNGLLLAASPDGRLLATRGAATQDLDLWRVVDGTRLAHLTGASDSLYTAAFSPDSRLLAAAGAEGIVFVWEVDSGTLVHQWPANMDRVRALIFSPDGSNVWIGGDGEVELRLVQSADGTLVRAFPSTNSGVEAMALAPDGQTLAATSGRIDVQLWSTADGTQLGHLTGPSSDLKSLAWSPDGSLLAAGGWDKTVTVWDASSTKTLARLSGHTDSVYTVLFAPDGQLLISVGTDSTVRLWGVYGP